MTNGLAPVVVGWMSQGVEPITAWPWLIGAPIACSILPAITLSAVPDRDADRAAGKRTLPGRFGVPFAIRFAQAAAVVTWLSAIWAWSRVIDWRSVVVPLLLGLAAAHGLLLIAACQRLLRAPEPARRIDRVMVLALTYITWFAAIPLVAGVLPAPPP